MARLAVSEPPRGLVAPYRPKDDPSGPAVVLKEDVLAMEAAAAANAELLREQEASSRRAPTVMNMKAPASAYPPPDILRPKRSRAPLFVLGGLGAVLVVVLAVTLSSRSRAKNTLVPTELPATATASSEAMLEVPPPVPVTELPEAPAETAPVDESPREASPAATSRAPSTSKAASKAPPKKVTPKAATKASPKPASGTTTASPTKSGDIVRDTPF